MTSNNQMISVTSKAIKKILKKRLKTNKFKLKQTKKVPHSNHTKALQRQKKSSKNLIETPKKNIKNKRLRIKKTVSSTSLTLSLMTYLNSVRFDRTSTLSGLNNFKKIRASFLKVQNQKTKNRVNKTNTQTNKPKKSNKSSKIIQKKNMVSMKIVRKINQTEILYFFFL